MLAVVNFAWRNAQVLHHFISTNEAVNEKYFFRLSPIAIASQNEWTSSFFSSEMIIEHEIFCIRGWRKS